MNLRSLVLAERQKAIPPGRIRVYRINPPWYHGSATGWWFVGDFDAPEEAVFQAITKSHATSRREISHKIYPWKYRGYKGWWTISDSAASAAHHNLESLGWHLDYEQELPFEQRKWIRHEPKPPMEKLWYGDYTVLMRGILLMLSCPSLKSEHKDKLSSTMKEIKNGRKLMVGEVINIRALFRRPAYLKWLKFKGFSNLVPKENPNYIPPEAKLVQDATDLPAPQDASPDADQTSMLKNSLL